MRPTAVAVVAVGLVLLVGKVSADSEPGAVPLLLVLVGLAWYVTVRVRARAPRG